MPLSYAEGHLYVVSSAEFQETNPQNAFKCICSKIN